MERPSHINQKHWNELMDSGISPKIASLNFWTIKDAGEADALLNRNNKRRWKHSQDLVPGWAVAGVDVETGERSLLGVQLKPDKSRVQLDKEGNPKYNADGTLKTRKYESASEYPAEPLFLDTGEAGYWKRVESDRLIPLLVCEGAKKSAAALSHDYAAISIPGVSCGQKLGHLKEELEKFCYPGRTVYLCFDNDLMTNRNVCLALDKLGRLIEACGAVVKVPLLPEGEAKGLDDFLAKHGKDAFAEVFDGALTFPEWRQEFGKTFLADSEDFGEKCEKKSQATLLVELAISLGIDLFHNPDGDGFADVQSDEHRATYKLRSKAFKDWLNRHFYLKHGSTANSQAMQDALNVLDGQARFDGPERPVYVRMAEHEGSIYLDLGTDDWSAIAISPDGWQIVSDPPVRFKRPKGLLPLPMPEQGGSISQLLDLINIKPDDWPLVAAWLLFCFNPTHSKPILMLSGEQGSGKSSVAKWLKRLIDPNKADLRQPPKDGRDLMIAATNSWTLAFDNLSHVPNDLSDALCRLSTGGGFATRKLYEDDEETILEATRPAILTGIEELASRSDLLDRMVLVNLPVISEADRQPESEIEAEFEELRPLMLGALLTAVAATLKKLPETTPESLPRMADFARWGVAGEAALGLEPGSFMQAYRDNRETANETALDLSPVAQAIQRLMTGQTAWMGTAVDLLEDLSHQVDEQTRRLKMWPQTPKGLSSILRRLAPNLRAISINVTFAKERTNRGRLIYLDKIDQAVKQPSQPSQPSKEISKTAPSNGYSPVTVQHELVTVQKPTVTTVTRDSNSVTVQKPTVTAITQPSHNRHKLKPLPEANSKQPSDGCDGCDCSFGVGSNGHKPEFKIGDLCFYAGSDPSFMRMAEGKRLQIVDIQGGVATLSAFGWVVNPQKPLAELRLAA